MCVCVCVCVCVCTHVSVEEKEKRKKKKKKKERKKKGKKERKEKKYIGTIEPTNKVKMMTLQIIIGKISSVLPCAAYTGKSFVIV